MSTKQFWTAIGKRRYLKRFLSSLMPGIGSVKVKSDLTMYVDLKDWSGPSFYLMLNPARNFNTYEGNQKRFLLENFTEDGVFLDVGANIGLYSLFVKANRPNSQVFAFEPHPLLAQCLRETNRSNSECYRIQEFEMGLGKAEEQLKLYFHPMDSGGHSAILDEFENQNSEKSTIIRVGSLDRFVEEKQLGRIDFIKIDVQDMEDQVILGGSKTIKQFTPHFLIEISNYRFITDPDFSNVFFQTFFNEIGSSRYRWCTAEDQGLSSSARDLMEYARKAHHRNTLYSDYFFLRTLV